MMKRYINKNAVILVLVIIYTTFLPAENILKILEGYGRDSTSTFSTQNSQAEAAKLFNLVLEPNGKITAERAEQYLNSTKSNIIKSYLSVMLADYSFVNNAHESGLRYLKRAVDEHDPIRNDSYYRMVLSRAQKSISESPGKEKPGKTSVLSEFNPTAVKIKPIEISPEKEVLASAKPTPKPVASSANNEEDNTTDVQIISEPKPALMANFRIQVGAFSVKDNAQRKLDYFEEKGYPVIMDKRERTSGYLYLAKIGAYASYDEAKRALTELKSKYPSEDGIVIKVEK